MKGSYAHLEKESPVKNGLRRGTGGRQGKNSSRGIHPDSYSNPGSVDEDK